MKKPNQQRNNETVRARNLSSASARLSQSVREIRLASGLKMTELANRSGLAVSTISKIENQQISPTYDTLVALADGLGVEVNSLVGTDSAQKPKSRRSIHRKGTGMPLESGCYDYSFLNADLVTKSFTPILTRIRARSLDEFPQLLSHKGEEFVYVLSGKVQLYTADYAPTLLDVGDSAYFDSTMEHALLSVSSDDAYVLWVSSTLSHLSELGSVDVCA